MAKVTVIGAGNVGGTCANVLLQKKAVSKIVLLDINAGLAEGKTIDITQSATLLGVEDRLVGCTNDYLETANSEVVVIASGIPRKPGMTREELIGTNANIVKSVTQNVLKHSPNAIIIVVSNPMDTMTYLALKTAAISKHKIIGMGGILDSARFKYYLSRTLNVQPKEIEAVVIGGHGDTTMIPLTRLVKVKGELVSKQLDEGVLKKIAADTMVGGATITGLLGTSAWYAPGAASAYLVDAILSDTKEVLPCSVYLEGEYGQSDICIGVPVVIGRNGWEKIIDLKLNDDESEAFNKSVAAVRGMNDVLDDMHVV